MSNCHIKHDTAACRGQTVSYPECASLESVSSASIGAHNETLFLVTFVVMGKKNTKVSFAVQSTLFIENDSSHLALQVLMTSVVTLIALYFPVLSKSTPNRGKQLSWLLLLHSNYGRFVVL